MTAFKSYATHPGDPVRRRTNHLAFGFALDRHAVERGVDPPNEAAVTLLVSLNSAHDWGMIGELPTIEEAVERRISATITLAEATRLATT
ncbi:hypothetical protein Pth03_11800 [Planotetraspora thailandica]|uniref:Uncharacterized protein n=1 Tax=Planotetraspora thailandica TaxID=487172 RepID=A0A8J3XUL9_9ACTN|nr:hypothetical protein Pth03_11800 [Planotetraspora thailandica]